MLNQLSDFGQVFVTTTSKNFFDKAENFASPVKYFKVQKGEVSVEAN